MEVPPQSRRRGLVGETWFPPREQAEGARRSRRGVGGAHREDLGLDDAGVAVIDRAEHCDGAALLARVADEELPRGTLHVWLVEGAHEVALAAAWASRRRLTS